MAPADTPNDPYRAPTLAEAAHQLRAGEVTSVALTEACLRRIEQVDGASRRA